MNGRLLPRCPYEEVALQWAWLSLSSTSHSLVSFCQLIPLTIFRVPNSSLQLQCTISIIVPALIIQRLNWLYSQSGNFIQSISKLSQSYRLHFYYYAHRCCNHTTISASSRNGICIVSPFLNKHSNSYNRLHAGTQNLMPKSFGQ